MCSGITSTHRTFLEPGYSGLESGRSMRGPWGGILTSHEPHQTFMLIVPLILSMVALTDIRKGFPMMMEVC
jgi:hypothetical protein